MISEKQMERIDGMGKVEKTVSAKKIFDSVMVNVNNGISEYPHSSYEEGVEAAMSWFLGYTNETPFPIADDL